MDNSDWLIDLMNDLDREMAKQATDEVRAAMGKLVKAVWEEFEVLTSASSNPLWASPSAVIQIRGH